MKDDWAKPRSRAQHLTEAEIEIISDRKRRRHPVREIARELQCSSGVVYKYFREIDGRERNCRMKAEPVRHVIKPRPSLAMKQSEEERRAKRFYTSNFEL